MADEPAPAQAIEDLLRDSRAARQSIHDLVLRMRRDRRAWERDLAQLLHRARLTAAQRQRLRDGYQARGGGSRGPTVC